jgi:hypothetical protein
MWTPMQIREMSDACVFKAILKCFAVYSAHPPWILSIMDKKYKKYEIFYEYAYWNPKTQDKAIQIFCIM